MLNSLKSRLTDKYARVNRRVRPAKVSPYKLFTPELLERRDLPAQAVLGSLLLDGSSLVLNGSTYTASGPVDIGYNPTGSESYVPLTIWNGNMSFASGGSSFDFSGTIQGIEQSSNISIAQIGSNQTFSVSSLAGSGVSISGGNSITIMGADFTSSLIALVDPSGGDTTNSYVSLQGSIGFSQLPGLSAPVSGTNSVQMSPSTTAPGLTLVAAASTSNFTAFGLNVGPSAISVGYSSSANNFQISGSIGVVTSSGDFSVSGSMGTATSPGLLIDTSGTVTQLIVTLSSNISTYGLNINANNLTLNYNPSAGDQYNITSGSISAQTSAGDFTFSGTFGCGTLPGVVLNNGSLTNLYATLNGSVVASGLTMTASNDVLQFNAANGNTPAQFQILSGSITVGSNTTDVNFSGSFGTANTPGVVLQGGTLTALDITVDSNMTVAGLNLSANAVEFTYNSTGSQFEIVSGTVSVVTTGVTFDGTFGTANSAGLVMSGSTLDSMDITVSSNMTVSGLTVTANGVEFTYNSTGSQFEIVSGSVSVVTSDVNFNGTFGTANSAGLVMSGSTLDSMDITVSSNMTVSGLTVTANGVEFTYNSTGSQFEIVSGSVSVVTSDVNFNGTFGTANSAGLVMTGSTLDSMDITVSSNMTVAGLSLTACGVEFIYNSSGSQFEIASGSVSVSGTGFSFDGVFGSGTGANATAGLSMSGSTLTGLDITVSSLINLDGMTLSVNNLQFIYENDANSIYNGDFIINTGNVTVATSANDTFFEAQFGCATTSTPGLVIHNNELASLYTTISSTISAQGIVLNAANLVFQYQGSTETFEIASGSVSVTSGDLQFGSAKFGVSGTPGLVIDNGSLTSLNITISSNMSVMGMDLDISNMTFIYYSVSGQTYGNFEIGAGGSISLSAGTSSNPLTFSGIFGNSSNSTPGLVINNGDLESFYIGITSNISAGGMTISTSDLTFTYQSSSNTFQIPSGSISVTATDFNFNGTFGSTLSNGTTVPGLVVSNGTLTELNTTVTSSLVAGGLTFSLDNLNFYYNSAGNQYEIDSGNISFKTSEGFSFSADFGLPNPSNTSETLPGLVISNGVFTEFNAALYASFTVAGLTIDVNDMAMSYNSSQFEMYGTVTVDTADVQFTGTIGDPTASPPAYGLVIDNGSLELCNITINSNITFGDLSMQAQNLTFNYSASPEEFSLYGNVSISVDGVNLTGNLGNSTIPGLSLVNGQLNTLNLGVTTDFTLFGLTCNVEDLTFIYEASASGATYILYGDLSVSIADGESTQTIAANLGTQTDPGMTIVGSTVTEINMALTADFTVDGFGFDVVDAGIEYQSTDGTYQIYGTFTLSDVFSASVELGTDANPGITVSNSVFIVDEIAITLDNVPMGAFTLNYVDISYESSNDEWQGGAAVTFPTGWEIGANMTFINGDLDDISLFYSAGTSQGIEIPDTGIAITYMEASLQNLDEPASIIVSGSIVGDFGGQISIGGTTCRIFTAMGSFSADSQQLVISGDYYLGAYQTNNSNPLTNWTGILGSGSASVDLNWSAGTYTADMSCSLYGGIFVVSAELAFNDEGDLGLIATATVEVPNAVPFIGGTKLGSISFAFIYTASSNSGLVAAWTTINCGINITTGFQYNFSSGSSGDFQLIGAGGVNNIENDFNSITSSDNSVPPTYVYSYTVTVPSGSGANGLSVIGTWPSNSGTQTLGVSLPSNQTAYYYPNATAPSNVEFLTSYTTPTTQSILTSGSSTNTTVLLPAGTYTFQLQSSTQFASQSCVTFTNQLYYEAPNITVSSVPTKALAFTPNLTGYAAGALAPNATITVYTDTDSSGYNGKSAGTFAYSVSNTATGGSLLNVPSIDLSSYAPGVPIYIYAIINDGTNTPVNSTYSSAIIPVPNVVGQVLDQFSNPISGIRAFLDLNDDGNYDAPVVAANGTITTPGDPSAITNASGSYFFNNLESYSSTDIGYPDFRVMLVMPSLSFTPITPSDATIDFTLDDSSTSSSSPVESVVANFTVNRLASITGSIYSDLVQNGVYGANDPALGGAVVFLDTNGNGQYDTSDLTCETGPSGTYGFYDLTPANYTTGLITSTTVSNVTTNNYVVTQPSCGTYSIPIVSDAQQLGNFSFTGPYTYGVISLATVCGTINNQTTSTSIASPLAGVTINISTPNLTASVPNYSGFASLSGLNLINSPNNIQNISIANYGFETPSVGTGYVYDPTGASWTFTGSAGVEGNNSAWGAAPAPQGTQAAFLQETGVISQSISGFTSGQNYDLTFMSAQRPGDLPQSFTVSMDGTVLGTYIPASTAFQAFTIPLVNVSGGSHTFTFTGLNPNGTDQSVFIDNVQIGSSVSSSGSLYLMTSGSSACSTAAWYNKSIPITSGFESTFQWTMSTSGTTSGGMAFVLQNCSTSSVGNSNFGYGGLTNSIGVVFDAVNNQISIETGGNTLASSALNLITSQELGFTLASGTVYTTRIVFLPTDTIGDGNLSVYLSGDSSGGSTPVLTTSVNLLSSLNLGSNSNAILGFTAGTPGTGLTSTIQSWSVTALNSQSTTTDSSGNYNFTGLMPLSNYTITQVTPANYVQSSPFNTVGIYSETSLTSLSQVVSSTASGDFNGDNIPDIAYSTSLNSGNSYQIMVAYGNGNGTFGASTLINLPVPASSPILANPSYGATNFDSFIVAGTFGTTSRDAIAYSAVMANGGHAIVVYDIYSSTILNLIEVENANYAPYNTSPYAGYAGTINNIAVGDLNNDGYDDLAVSTYGGIYTLVSLQNIQSSSTWSANPTVLANPLGVPSQYYANGTSGNTYATVYNAGVVLADFNQDGNLDMVTIGVQYIPEVASGKYGPVYTWTDMSIATSLQLAYGSGNGVSYTAQSQLLYQLYTEDNINQYFTSSGNSAPTFALPFGMAAADVTGDGIPDLVLNGYMDNLDPAVLLLEQVTGNFTYAGSFAIPNGKPFNINNTFGDDVAIDGSSTIPAQVIVMDINSDGYKDVVAVDPNFGQLMLLTTASAPLTTTQIQTTLELAGGALPMFVSADYNLDGYADFVVPGMNNYSTQTAPVMVLNGTMNVGDISYTPSNGQAMTGQDFTDMYFGGSAVSTISSSSMKSGVSTQSTSIRSAAVSTTQTLTGRVFVDHTMNSRFNISEETLSGLQLYLDLNQNGQYDPGFDPSTLTNDQGSYSFSDLQPGQSYTIGFANLPAQYYADPVSFSTPAVNHSGVIHRSLGVKEFWSIHPSNVSANPLIPMRIDISPLEYRATLDFKPFFQLIGNIPDGMTIDSYTGVIHWVPLISDAESTIDVTVQIQNPENPSLLQTQLNQFQIHVNSISPAMAYICNIYGTLLNRLPTAEEGSQWSSNLQSNTSRLSFVSAIANSDERYAILTKNTYLNVLSRTPSSSEYSSALQLFRTGGNSDQLTKSLLIGQEFVSQHRSNSDYVAAANRILLFKQPARQVAAWEVRWLRMGGSKSSLVSWIMKSQYATTAKSTQLSAWYSVQGQSYSCKTISQWSTALGKGSLNSDTLTIRILGSAGYANYTAQKSELNIQIPDNQNAAQYKRLAHLQFSVTGTDATRMQLDQLEESLYQGQSWKSVSGNLYNSQAATTARIQAQFKNLLHRQATNAEIASLTQSLPVANQTEALQIQILKGSEYRGRFSSTSSYVTAVYEVLTSQAPSSATLQSWINRLETGLSTSQFVMSVASSNAGRIGQIDRAYADFLMRDPSQLELHQWITRYRQSNPQDRTIALTLMNSDEFRQQQRTANLLPVSTQSK